MVEKELGLIIDEGGSPLQGALILAGAFAVAALVPIAPFFFLPVPVALVTAIVVSVVVMFFLGVAKSRLTLRNPVRSGLEIVALVLAASAGGWIFGSLLPRGLGFAGIGV
jgi:VIT1/CCC1 family predicted Fe2+/Mn2+ transporter